MAKKLLLISLALMTCAIMFSCGKKKSVCNEWNPYAPCYKFPSVELTSPVPVNDTLTTDTLRISWTGNSPYSEYKWRIDGNERSSYSTATNLSLLLDEGAHTLDVVTRYKDGKPEDTLLVSESFVVSALATPALYLYPRFAKRVGDKVSLELWSKGLPACNHISIGLNEGTFDTTSLNLDSAFINTLPLIGNILDMSIAPDLGKSLPSSTRLASFWLNLANTSLDSIPVSFTVYLAEHITATGETPTKINLSATRGSVVVE